RPRRTVSPRETPPALSVSLTGLVSLAVSGWAICLVSCEMVCGCVAKNAAHGHGPAGAADKGPVAALRAPWPPDRPPDRPQARAPAPGTAPRPDRGASGLGPERARIKQHARAGTVSLARFGGKLPLRLRARGERPVAAGLLLAAGSAQAQTLVGPKPSSGPNP